MASETLTPTERRMLAVLADGEPHSREEFHKCLCDNLGPLSNIRAHLCNLRKKLLPEGKTVLCVLHRGKPHYQQVRLLE